MKKTTQRCISLLIFIIGPGLCLAEDLPGNQKKTLLALGLKKIGQIVEHQDTPNILGMINKVKHLVTVIK